MKPRLLNLVIALLLLATPAFATTLEQLQSMAIEKRQVVEAYRLNIRKAQESKKIARAGYLPSIDLSYSINMLDEESTTEAEENSVFYGALSWNLFSGFKDKYTLSGAEIEKKIQQLNLVSIKQDIKFDVSLRYLAIFNSQASLAVAEDSFETLSKIYTDADNRYKVGIIKKNDVLKIRVDLDNAEIDLKKSQAQVQKSITLLGRAIDSDIEASDLDFSELGYLPTLDSNATCETRMVSYRSDVLALQEMVNSAQLAVKRERSRLYPSVDFTSSYSKYDDDYANGSGDIEEYEVRHQLTASINLFDGLASSAHINRAKYESSRSRYDLYELIRDLKTELKNIFLDLDVAKQNIVVASRSIKQAEENLRISRLTYGEGLSTASDLLDAITVLSRAKFNRVSAKTEYLTHYFTIMRMVEDF